MLTIRKTTLNDLDRVMELYDIGRNYMRANGNMLQWINGYPERDLVKKDISSGESYVVVDEDGIHAVFMFMQRSEPTYGYIEDGGWLNDLPYGTIHRIASDGVHCRILDLSVDFCQKTIKNLRIDTHPDNMPMQKAIKRCGFSYCGVIYMEDKTPRIAFQKTV